MLIVPSKIEWESSTAAMLSLIKMGKASLMCSIIAQISIYRLAKLMGQF